MDHVFLFNDVDKDELYSLNVLIAQDYLGSLHIDGIVAEDGFLSYPDNLCMLAFWLRELRARPIPVYRGIDRSDYLPAAAEGLPPALCRVVPRGDDEGVRVPWM